MVIGYVNGHAGTIGGSVGGGGGGGTPRTDAEIRALVDADADIEMVGDLPATSPTAVEPGSAYTVTSIRGLSSIGGGVSTGILYPGSIVNTKTALGFAGVYETDWDVFHEATNPATFGQSGMLDLANPATHAATIQGVLDVTKVQRNSIYFIRDASNLTTVHFYKPNATGTAWQYGGIFAQMTPPSLVANYSVTGRAAAQIGNPITWAEIPTAQKAPGKTGFVAGDVVAVEYDDDPATEETHRQNDATMGIVDTDAAAAAVDEKIISIATTLPAVQVNKIAYRTLPAPKQFVGIAAGETIELVDPATKVTSEHVLVADTWVPVTNG